MNCISNEVIKFIDEHLPASFHKEEGSLIVTWLKEQEITLVYLEYSKPFKDKYPQVKDYIGYLCSVTKNGNFTDYTYIRDDEGYEEKIFNLILEVCKND